MSEENQLAIIVNESGLDATKANFILEKFQDYFKLASEWEAKARTIIVTDEKQDAEMEMARVGRLFLRDKRIAIEKARKELKEQALREGKAIDGIANVLKALIVPIEEYLEKQEKFIEIKKKEKEQAILKAAAEKEEQERIAKEKADAEAFEKARIENEKLKKEAEEKEKALKLEREKVESERKEAERKAKAEQEKLKKEAEEKVRIEKEKFEKEKRAIEEKTRKEKEERETIRLKELAEKQKIELMRKQAEEKAQKEKERLEEMLKNQIECPNCGHKFQLKEN